MLTGASKAGRRQLHRDNPVASLAYDSLKPARKAAHPQNAASLRIPGLAWKLCVPAWRRPSRPRWGCSISPDDPVLSRFAISVLTEGSGTQIYSTTFVQWTAREALRRARPLTLLAKFAPRQTEESADEELSGIQQRAVLDPAGSLVDADMGAYYTWINLQRLSGADQSSFIAWSEGHGEAVAIGSVFRARHPVSSQCESGGNSPSGPKHKLNHSLEMKPTVFANDVVYDNGKFNGLKRV